ncbi:hypothetical protein DL93DRAFT_896557 [Clavulina sp. PMI_390]|nr:hypothetical protein DL93DRAFT_896557 [Clavulina sp. PMI_390]
MAAKLSDSDSRSAIRGTSPLSERDSSSKEVTLLAASAQITETTYSVSDIQTRIFEIQELRHQDLGPPSESPNVKSISVVIDDALVGLDQRLEAASRNISLLSSTLEPLSQQLAGLPQSNLSDLSTVVLRKHDTLLAEWENVQHEAASLREELKEDKWLLVFRNASDQADGMMNSLERIVDQCSKYAKQFHPAHLVATHSGTNASEKAKFDELQKSLLAKEKYYVPSVSKVLSVLDKGVKIRATKNGESLRRHADMRARWKALQLKISETDASMHEIKAFYGESIQPAQDSNSSHVHRDDRARPPNTPTRPPLQSRTRPPSRLSGASDPKPHALTSPSRAVSRRSSSQQLRVSSSITKPDSKTPNLSPSSRSVSQGAVRPNSRLSHPRSYSSAAMRRPMSPSQIPAPRFGARTSYDDDDDDDDDASVLPRAVTPSFSIISSPATNTPHAKRQSLLPLPRRELRAPSPSQSRSISHNPSVFSVGNKDPITPSRPPRSSARSNEGGPSSFTPLSRPSSRLSVVSSNLSSLPYSPNMKDPLDVEIASLVNTVKHPFQVERVDPHIRHLPLSGEEMKAQYAFTSRLGRKVLACKLLIIHRAAPKTIAGHIPTRKVMCRIGGGEQVLYAPCESSSEVNPQVGKTWNLFL